MLALFRRIREVAGLLRSRYAQRMDEEAGSSCSLATSSRPYRDIGKATEQAQYTHAKTWTRQAPERCSFGSCHILEALYRSIRSATPLQLDPSAAWAGAPK